MITEKRKKKPSLRLTKQEINAVCATLVSRMLSPDWHTLSEEDQKTLIMALDKMRQFK